MPQIAGEDASIVASELEIIEDSYGTLCDKVGAAVSRIVEKAAKSDMFTDMRELKEQGEAAAEGARQFVRNATIDYGAIVSLEAANWALLIILCIPHAASILTCVYALLSYCLIPSSSSGRRFAHARSLILLCGVYGFLVSIAAQAVCATVSALDAPIFRVRMQTTSIVFLSMICNACSIFSVIQYEIDKAAPIK